MSFILTVAPNLLKGRVALERKKFRKFQILTVVALDYFLAVILSRHVL